MDNPKDVWKQILKESKDSADDVNELEAIIKDFTEVLDEDSGISATLIPSGSLGDSFSIAMSPNNKPDERSLMISYTKKANAIEFIDFSTTHRAETKEQVTEYLTEFLQSPAFQNTLRIYRSRSLQPHEGTLRTVGPETLASSDVLVRISEPVQQELARIAGSAQTIDVQVSEDPNFPLAHYNPMVTYKYFDADGFLFLVEAHKRSEEGESILLTVRPDPNRPIFHR